MEQVFSTLLEINRNYSSSPLVQKHTNHHQNHHLSPLQSTSFLDDCEKVSTNHNTPIDELYDKQPETENGNITDSLCLFSSSEIDIIEEFSPKCCSQKGIAFCCLEFEYRIFTWVEKNVPKMANPQSKKDSFFQAKRSLIRSMTIQPQILKKQRTNSKLTSENLNINDTLIESKQQLNQLSEQSEESESTVTQTLNHNRDDSSQEITKEDSSQETSNTSNTPNIPLLKKFTSRLLLQRKTMIPMNNGIEFQSHHRLSVLISNISEEQN